MLNVRAHIILVCFFLLNIALVGRLFILQVRDGALYRARAQGQQELLQEVFGDRGRIFFKGGEYLANNERQNLIYFSPNDILAEEELPELLSEILKEDILGLIDSGIICRELTDEQMLSIQELNHPLLNKTEKRKIRFYPQGEMAAHVVGFLGGYQIGQYGLEGYYDQYLQGQSSFMRSFSFLNLNNEEDDSTASAGDDLYLTIDYNIQFQAEQLLKEAKEDWQIEGGTIIVSDPKTGRILAMANYPSFDPNFYSNETLDRFINPATQRLFEPGSIFKVVTMAAGLNEYLVSPETTYHDTGSVSVGGPPIYNYRQRVWGEQSMIEVLNKSINTGSVFVQQKLGRELFLKYVDLFGFTRPTEIDLAGEEFSANQTLKKGYERDLATASFGQGIATTPIQLMMAINAIANDGILMKPFVVEKRISYDGVVYETHPEEVGQAINARVAAQTTMMMVDVVSEGYGRPAGVAGYLIAGKTGTAQIPKPGGGYLEETIHGFAGYGPALDPAFSILIKLDAPQAINSSESAGPIFGKLAQYILNYYQIMPETSG
jgi:cell division protein FtsI/penicillin-binding protein 2